MTIQTTILCLILYFGKGFRGSCGHPPAAPGAASFSIPAGIPVPPTVSSSVAATARNTEPMRSPLTSCAKWRASGTMIMKKLPATLKSSPKIRQKFLQAQILETVPERHSRAHTHSLRTPRWRGLQEVLRCPAQKLLTAKQWCHFAPTFCTRWQLPVPRCALPQTPLRDQRHRWPPAAAPPLAASIIARRMAEETFSQFFKEKLSSTSPQNLVRYIHRSQGSW